MHPSDEGERPLKRTATIVQGIKSLNLGYTKGDGVFQFIKSQFS